ncbi:hypothetical protein NQ315_009635 [Exocentrus adspersus]|uniref:CHK kinase-like domain-containing protein n=1 Tax=Exocentrus adspersus TaxID=1586481 RepID=A0AAV8WI02_9CUCU|nr:hypothetical protein NQ315_009635 [Exocentrus adspersus]
MAVTENDIKTHIKNAFRNQNLLNCEVTLKGTNDTTDGYASFITFATVSATYKDGSKEEINIAVKVSRESLIQNFRYAYDREAYLYSTIFPTFTKFQHENQVEDLFKSVPICYKTIADEKLVVIILEDLKQNGYRLHDRKNPMDLNHLKLVLREYGKFHAVSFALRHKRKEDFKKLVNNFSDSMINIIDDAWKQMIKESFVKVCGTMKEIGKLELYEVCNSILQKDPGDLMLGLLKTDEAQSAVLHGDCWNNNFLFKYKVENNKMFPLQVAIVDWQLARLHSPVLDLSYFLYSTSSEEQLERFDELLEGYYSSFSSTIRELGCEPEELYSFTTLKEHWKKYSLFGILMVVFCLHAMMADKEETANIDADSEDRIRNFMDMEIKNVAEYHKRLVACLGHYKKYTDT